MSDPLYRNVVFAHRVDLPVLGVPVAFESNSALALAAVESAFGKWRAYAARRDLIAPEGARVRIIVHEGTEPEGDRGRLSYRLPDPSRMLVHTPGSVGICDLTRRESVAYVTESLLSDAESFGQTMLGGLTLTLVASLDRHPMHAAAVTRPAGNLALLLAAPSGVGKSTVAYAAVRTGLRVLTDDSTYVQLEPRLRIWGMPDKLSLTPEAARHFPELVGATPTRLPNGKTKILVAGSDDGWPDAPVVERAVVCVLQRGAREVSMERVDAAPIERALATELEYSMYGPTMRVAVQRLCEGGGWRLTLSDDPHAAVPFLWQILEAADAGG